MTQNTSTAKLFYFSNPPIDWVISIIACSAACVGAMVYHDLWRAKTYSMATVNESMALACVVGLTLSLSMGPLARMTGRTRWLQLRRTFGVTAVFFVGGHIFMTLTFLWSEYHLKWFFEHPFSSIFGIMCAVALFFLTLTSFRKPHQLIGKTLTQCMHRYVTLIFIMALAHYVILGKPQHPWWMGKVASWLDWLTGIDTHTCPPGTFPVTLLACGSLLLRVVEVLKKRGLCKTICNSSFTILLLCLMFVVGCGNPEPSVTELEVLCGSSFVPPSEELCHRFEKQTGIRLLISSAGSEDFLPLIKAGQKGDILISHDPFLDEVKKANGYFDHVSVGFVAPVLAVQKGNPKQLTKLEDLSQPGLKVALSNPQYSTCGEMVFELLKEKNILESVLINVENRLTKGHSVLGNFLKTQSVDATIMWNGVAHTFSDAVDIVKTPYEYKTEIRVQVIGLSYSKQKEALKKFMDFIRIEGTKTFERYGYTK